MYSFKVCMCCICLLQHLPTANLNLAFCVCRVDHHYTFFVQWSHKMNTKDKKKARRPCRYVVGDKNNNRYLVLEKDKVNAINKLLIKNDSPAANNWQVSLSKHCIPGPNKASTVQVQTLLSSYCMPCLTTLSPSQLQSLLSN